MSDERPAADRHVPVLRDRCINLLAPSLDARREAGRTAVVVDATLGMGGHAEALLERFPEVHLVGVDRDQQALRLAGERLARFADRTDLVHAVYDELPEVLDGLGIVEIDGALFDLGVSSLQLDERDRGFAYSYDAPLDMRMDTSSGPTAADVVNGYAEAELVRIIRAWGEEKFAGRIASAIIAARKAQPFRNTGELVDVIRQVVPASAARTGGHPAKRTFQALRIEVNQELAVLEGALPAAIKALTVGGRMVVMSYHSLEDRMVKNVFAAGARSSAPAGFPVELEQHKAYLQLVTRGTEAPTEQEVRENPRAASARLRAVERTRTTPAMETRGKARAADGTTP
jgi:16S rRNA (cytosine1402-N4)-methyltransferase